MRVHRFATRIYTYVHVGGSQNFPKSDYAIKQNPGGKSLGGSSPKAEAKYIITGQILPLIVALSDSLMANFCEGPFLSSSSSSSS